MRNITVLVCLYIMQALPYSLCLAAIPHQQLQIMTMRSPGGVPKTELAHVPDLSYLHQHYINVTQDLYQCNHFCQQSQILTVLYPKQSRTYNLALSITI